MDDLDVLDRMVSVGSRVLVNYGWVLLFSALMMVMMMRQLLGWLEERKREMERQQDIRRAWRMDAEGVRKEQEQQLKEASCEAERTKEVKEAEKRKEWEEKMRLRSRGRGQKLGTAGGTETRSVVVERWERMQEESKRLNQARREEEKTAKDEERKRLLEEARQKYMAGGQRLGQE
mmetsp:Transcript_11652/g.23690  ORF Transcript_11652/g.23690 Transcript_11652/m.23690 type:complete len:176 (-) Transcript_11652:187-714(-)